MRRDRPKPWRFGGGAGMRACLHAWRAATSADAQTLPRGRRRSASAARLCSTCRRFSARRSAAARRSPTRRPRATGRTPFDSVASVPRSLRLRSGSPEQRRRAQGILRRLAACHERAWRVAERKPSESNGDVLATASSGGKIEWISGGPSAFACSRLQLACLPSRSRPKGGEGWR